MASRRFCSLIGLAIAAALLPVASASPGSIRASAMQSCGRGSWIAGTVDVCDGKLIYRDYLYDDYGADRSDPTAPTTGSLARPAGDERYPEGQENTADIIDLSLRIDGGELEAHFELGALYEPDSTIAALAIDTDDDEASGGGEWEGLGVSSEGWDKLYKFAQGDPATNVITGRVPIPEGETWRVQAVAAKKDGTVMNVAFRGTDEETATGSWWDDKQAAALRNGDISEFGLKVDVADLRNGITRVADVAPGFHQRVYVSDYTMRKGEGMSYDPEFGRHGDTGSVCEQEFHFFGKYQPYGLYVPDKPGPHGCNSRCTAVTRITRALSISPACSR